MRLIVLLAAISSGLSACQTTGGCPPLVAYSRAQQQQAAAELRALPRGSEIGAMIVDYGKTRDACRAGEAR